MNENNNKYQRPAERNSRDERGGRRKRTLRGRKISFSCLSRCIHSSASVAYRSALRYRGRLHCVIDFPAATRFRDSFAFSTFVHVRDSPSLFPTQCRAWRFVLSGRPAGFIRGTRTTQVRDLFPSSLSFPLPLNVKALKKKKRGRGRPRRNTQAQTQKK